MATRTDAHRTLEAVIHSDGRVVLLSPIHLSEKRRALVTILDEPPPEVLTGTLSDPSPQRADDQLDCAGVLSARYRMIRRLSSGGMGVAYQGEDLRTGRSVCIKRLHP